MTTHDMVEDLALGAFRLVKEKLAFELDFTPETLPVLDHYLKSLRDEDGGAPDEKVVALVAPCAGAYFGEVIRRSLPGLRWHHPPDDYAAWRIEAAHVFLCFNPIGMVLEALHDRSIPGWNAHITLLPDERDIIEGSLENAGPVREEDFHRLAVRHEVIEQAVTVLQDLAHARGEPRTFGPDAYRSIVAGEPGAVEA